MGRWKTRFWVQQIELNMEAGNCPTLNMNAMHNYLLSHSLNILKKWRKGIFVHDHINFDAFCLPLHSHGCTRTLMPYHIFCQKPNSANAIVKLWFQQHREICGSPQDINARGPNTVIMSHCLYNQWLCWEFSGPQRAFTLKLRWLY